MGAASAPSPSSSSAISALRLAPAPSRCERRPLLPAAPPAGAAAAAGLAAAPAITASSAAASASSSESGEGSRARLRLACFFLAAAGSSSRCGGVSPSSLGRLAASRELAGQWQACRRVNRWQQTDRQRR